MTKPLMLLKGNLELESSFYEYIFSFSGSFSSIRKAAEMYGVACRTLNTLINKNKSFEGMGRKWVHLSNEEEEAVVAK